MQQNGLLEYRDRKHASRSFRYRLPVLPLDAARARLFRCGWRTRRRSVASYLRLTCMCPSIFQLWWQRSLDGLDCILADKIRIETIALG